MEAAARSSSEPRGEAEAGLKLTKLSDADDVEAYLTTFERMMQAYKIPKERWVYKLAPQLTGRAQQAYAAMPTADAGKYDDVKAAILRRYDINSETYRQRFRSIRLNEGESHREMATRLSDLIDKWMKECKSAKEVCELIVIEQLLETLPSEVRVWVRERKPKTSTEAGQLADDYVQARKTTQRSGSRKPGEKSREHAPVETKTQSSKHQGGDSPPHKSHATRNASDRKGQRKKQKCFNCRGIGHIAAECPSDAIFCKVRRAPNRKPGRLPPRQELTLKGEVEGKIVEDMLLDTGCSQTLVRQEVVPDENLTNRQVSIRCAYGDILEYPVADVRIRICDKEFTVKAGVSNRLPRSAESVTRNLLSRRGCPTDYLDQFYEEQTYPHGESC